jgi:hypothetical protein
MTLIQVLSVRNRAGSNPHTPPDSLIELSNDPDWLVRSNLARNPSLDMDTLMKLFEDVKFTVRKSATETGRI